MKKTIVLILILTFFFICNSVFTQSEFSKESLGLRGDVKTVIERRYTTKIEFDKPQADALKTSYFFKYDKNGNLFKIREGRKGLDYDSNYRTFYFNTDNQLIKSLTRDAVTNYCYNSDGRIEEITKFFSSFGKSSRRDQVRSRDQMFSAFSRGGTYSRNADGKAKYRFTYNEHGDLINWVTSGKYGATKRGENISCIKCHKFYYDFFYFKLDYFNSKEYIIGTVVSDINSLYLITPKESHINLTVDYEYDDRGNWIKAVYTNLGKGKRSVFQKVTRDIIVTRDITYY